MPKLKQPNYFKVRSIGYCMNMLLSLPRQSPKGDSFGKFCNCLVRSYKNLWWNHIAPVQSIKEARFMELKVARRF